jgi:hypothetical protein
MAKQKKPTDVWSVIQAVNKEEAQIPAYRTNEVSVTEPYESPAPTRNSLYRQAIGLEDANGNEIHYGIFGQPTMPWERDELHPDMMYHTGDSPDVNAMKIRLALHQGFEEQLAPYGDDIYEMAAKQPGKTVEDIVPDIVMSYLGTEGPTWKGAPNYKKYIPTRDEVFSIREYYNSLKTPPSEYLEYDERPYDPILPKDMRARDIKVRHGVMHDMARESKQQMERQIQRQRDKELNMYTPHNYVPIEYAKQESPRPSTRQKILNGIQFWK